MPQILVLSVGSDPMVLDTRDLILRSAGYIVASAASIREAVHLFQDGDFDVVILCHSLPVKDCERLTSFIRASGSRIPIVSISETGFADRATFADATLDKDPAKLLGDLRDLICRHTQIKPIGVAISQIDTEIPSAKKAPRFSSGVDPYERGNQDRLGTLNFLNGTRERAPSH